MKKLIYNALYFVESRVKSPNQKSRGVDEYIKSSFVSLYSAKSTNPDCDVALICNNPLPKYYSELFKKHNISTIIVEFDNYMMPSNFKWEYAFYKLKALQYVVKNTEYDFLLGVDTDAYFTDNLKYLWNECEFNFPLLYVLGASMNHPVRMDIMNDYFRLYDKKENILMMGGEFIAGSKVALKALIENIDKTYDLIQKSGYSINETSGDEAIISIAAHHMKTISAAPYIRRYWTRRAFYDADTSWGRIPVWHLPAEKNYGLIKVFEYFLRKKKLPTKRYCIKIFNLPVQKRYTISMIKYYLYSILNSKLE